MPNVAEKAVLHQFATYYDLYCPDGPGRKPLVIATHGYSGDKSSMMRLAQKVNKNDYVIAALQGPHQHFKRLGDPRTPKQQIGFGWLTPWKPEESKKLHHDSISAIIDDLVEQGLVDSSKVFLLAFSQSASLNLRYALTFPERIRGHVSICGGIPFDLLENPSFQFGHLDALFVHMNQDEFYPPERVEENIAKLRSVEDSIDLEMLEGGHTVAPAMFPMVDAWIKQRLG